MYDVRLIDVSGSGSVHLGAGRLLRWRRCSNLRRGLLGIVHSRGFKLLRLVFVFTVGDSSHLRRVLVPILFRLGEDPLLSRIRVAAHALIIEVDLCDPDANSQA